MGFGGAGRPLRMFHRRESLARIFFSGLFQCIAIVAIAFAFLRLAPGSPADALAGISGTADPAARAHLELTHGLGLPLHQQFLAYTQALSRGDLGTSIYFDTPVTSLLAQRLPITTLLTTGAISLALLLGTACGIFSAVRPRSHFNSVVIAVAIVLQAVPTFVLATVLMLLIGRSGLLPVFGVQAFAGDQTFGTDMLLHLATPTVALTLALVAPYILIARTAMAGVLPQDYIRLARAKGLFESRVLAVHALPNAAIPVLMTGGQQFTTLIGGAIVIETFFGLPGLGRLVVEAALRRDYPVVSSVILINGFAVVLVYRLCDVAMAFIDPRIGSARERR